MLTVWALFQRFPHDYDSSLVSVEDTNSDRDPTIWPGKIKTWLVEHTAALKHLGGTATALELIPFQGSTSTTAQQAAGKSF